jgi:hypothetical protein
VPNFDMTYMGVGPVIMCLDVREIGGAAKRRIFPVKRPKPSAEDFNEHSEEKKERKTHW